jgi:hypothetical protein
MTPSDDPFDPHPTAELLATDALLDRVAARAPTSDDLDDPLIAALALMAAEIDLGAVPVEETRARLARAVPELAAPPPPDAPADHEPTGTVIDLRDSAAVRRTPGRDEVRRSARPPLQPERTAPPVAMAPPRSLPRMPAPGAVPAGSRAPRGRRERTMRPVVVVVVAVAAIVLGSSVSAALTGGRSVNPLDGVQQVVAGLTHGRTQEQLAARQKAQKYLLDAETAVQAGQTEKARQELAKITPQLLAQLYDDDRAVIKAGIERISRFPRR